ncbi:hypothetical protein AOCH_007217 [Aspergillus ochraceoroseus]|uniref:Peptidase family M13 protein n=1 Tax=Aspergillus ochraceoroseus TaxID=138278 RepID=A0A0F8TZ95_9EURO|nr:hypothetical protein AOCH_007217 [Aspergillus ochraceoroseus]
MIAVCVHGEQRTLTLCSDEGCESTSLLREHSEPQLEKRRVFFGHTEGVRTPGQHYVKTRRCSSLRTWLPIVCYSALSLTGIVLFILVGGYFGALFIYGPPENEPVRTEAPSICQTPECINAASEILRNMDPDYEHIDPCTNFDQYACGGWRNQHDMRPDQGSIFAGTLMQEASETRLRHLLESPEPSDPADSKIFKKLKSAYNACMDEKTVSRRGTKPLANMLEEFEKIYAVNSASEGSDVDLNNALLYLIKSGVDALLTTYVSPDDRDPDKVTIFVNPPREIGLPSREYYNNTKTVEDYSTMLDKVLGGLLAKEKHVVDDIVSFESKLADISPDTQTQADVTKYYNPRSIEETRSLLPQVSLSDIISDLAPSDFKTDRLIIGSPSYMESLSKLLDETRRETVQAFFEWKIIQTYAGHIEDKKIKPLREFNNVLLGKDPQATQDRWRKCIGSLDEDLGWILSRFYVLSAFSEESKKLGDQVVSDIKERFVYTLHQTSWMSPKVRELGIQKVGNIVQKIGYPTNSPNVMDATNVEEYYRNLSISSESFFENGVAVAKFGVGRAGRNWESPPTGMNGPPVFYGPSAPLYLAYGAFGAVSGHELSHAFDSTGRHYDETGNYTNWWDEKTVESFKERAQCFIDQYSEFTVPGKDSEPLHVNGRLTLGENIADAGGLGAAYHAWKKHDESHPDRHLPGLTKFSKEQLFFMSYANWWCSKTSPEAAQRAIYVDPHAPKPARIIGTMSNSVEFKEAFSCPSKEPVCKLW